MVARMVLMEQTSFRTKVLLFIIFFFGSGSGKFDYCKFNCEVQDPFTNEYTKHNNTACGGCPTHPNTVEEYVPDFHFRQRVLHWHNFYRNRLASGIDTAGGNGAASDMLVMNYDMWLEFYVSCWVFRSGEMQHDKCRKSRNPDWMFIGQNVWSGDVYMDPRPDYGLKIALLSWYREFNMTKAEWIDNYPDVTISKPILPKGKEIGHFTQMVWSRTNHIGCAMARFRSREENNAIWYYLGCNYGPGGNIVDNRPVYRRGEPATACPKGTKRNKRYPNLCGEQRPWEKDAYMEGNPELREQRGLDSTSIHGGDNIMFNIELLLLLYVFGLP